MKDEWKDEGEGLKIPREVVDCLEVAFMIPGILHGYCQRIRKKRGCLIAEKVVVDTSTPGNAKMTYRAWLKIRSGSVISWPVSLEERENMCKGLRSGKSGPESKILRTGFQAHEKGKRH